MRILPGNKGMNQPPAAQQHHRHGDLPLKKSGAFCVLVSVGNVLLERAMGLNMRTLQPLRGDDTTGRGDAASGRSSGNNMIKAHAHEQQEEKHDFSFDHLVTQRGDSENEDNSMDFYEDPADAPLVTSSASEQDFGTATSSTLALLGNDHDDIPDEPLSALELEKIPPVVSSYTQVIAEMLKEDTIKRRKKLRQHQMVDVEGYQVAVEEAQEVKKAVETTTSTSGALVLPQDQAVEAKQEEAPILEPGTAPSPIKAPGFLELSKVQLQQKSVCCGDQSEITPIEDDKTSTNWDPHQTGMAGADLTDNMMGYFDYYYKGFLLKPLETPYDEEGKETIPRILHRMFLSGTSKGRNVTEDGVYAQMAEPMKRAFRSWPDINPDYKAVFYNMEQAEEFINEHYLPRVYTAFKAIKPNAYKGDLFRLLVLYKVGGWYVDLKIEYNKKGQKLEKVEQQIADYQAEKYKNTKKKITPLNLGFIGACQSNTGAWMQDGIMNAVLAAKPGNPFLGDAIYRIITDVERHDKGDGIFSMTGPVGLFRILQHDPGQGCLDIHGERGDVAMIRWYDEKWFTTATKMDDTTRFCEKSDANLKPGAGWDALGGNKYDVMWRNDDVFRDDRAPDSSTPSAKKTAMARSCFHKLKDQKRLFYVIKTNGACTYRWDGGGATGGLPVPPKPPAAPGTAGTTTGGHPGGVGSTKQPTAGAGGDE